MINVEAVASFLASQPGASGDSSLVASLLTIANTMATSSSGFALSASGATPARIAKLLEEHTGLSLAPGTAPPENDVARGEEVSTEEAQAEGIERFSQRYPMDMRAYEYLVTSSSVVVTNVLESFKPPREGDADYSSLVTAFVKRMRLKFAGGGPSSTNLTFVPPPRQRSREHAGKGQTTVIQRRSALEILQQLPEGSEVPPGIDVADAMAEFLAKYPHALSERAYTLFLTAPQSVQLRVLREIQQGPQLAKEHVAQPLAHDSGIIAFVPEAVPADLATALATPGLDQFFLKYPVDERAYDYFAQSSREVQDRVLQNFQAKREGESSYSGLFTSFVKRVRNSIPAEGGKGRGGLPAGMGYSTIDDECEKALFDMDSVLLDDFRGRFPMDDRAFQFLCQSPKEVQDRVRECFKPQRPDDIDFSAPVTAYVKTLRRQLVESNAHSVTALQQHQEAGQFAWTHGGSAHHSNAAYGSLSGLSMASSDEEERSKFFERYPCDARAIDYLESSSPEVQAQVIAGFRPRSEGDADYSAALTAFVKRVRYADKGRGKGDACVKGDTWGEGDAWGKGDAYSFSSFKRPRMF